MGFSRQEYWSRLSFPTPGDLPNSGIKPIFLVSPVRAPMHTHTHTHTHTRLSRQHLLLNEEILNHEKLFQKNRGSSSITEWLNILRQGT